MKAKHYLVGGAVRDQLLGLSPKDFDYSVEAESYDAMKEDILARGGTIFLEKPEFFTIRAKVNKIDADFVLARKEGDYSDGRRPDSVEIGTIDDDLARRDFTVNAMARLEDGTIYDPFNGQVDLALKRLVCVGNAHARFSEDYLRLLRAVRFSIVKGFELDNDIHDALCSPEILRGLYKISKERIREELVKCFAHDTWKTLLFFEDYSNLHEVIFKHIKINLVPKISQ